MHIRLFHVHRRILNIVVDSVQDCALLDYEHAEVLEKDRQWVYWICQFTDFFASMFGLNVVEVFLVEDLRLVNALLSLSLLYATTPMQLLNFHVVVFLHLSQLKCDILQSCGQDGLHIFPNLLIRRFWCFRAAQLFQLQVTLLY